MATLPVPFDGGIQQGADPARSPGGTLFRVTDGRVPREGGLAPRWGTVQLTKSQSATSQPFGAGRPHAAAGVLGRDVVALSERAYARDTVTRPEWQEVGRPARYLPIKGHWLALNGTTTVDTPPHVAAMAGSVCVVYVLGSGGVQILLYDESMVCRFSQLVSGRRNPRVMVVGSVFVVTYEDNNASPTIVYLRTLTPSTLALGSELSFITRQTANDRYDAAPYSSTEIVWSARTGTTTWTVQRLQISPLSIIATRSITVANSVHAYERVYNNNGDGIYAAFYVAGGGTGTVAACNNALSSDSTSSFGTNAAQHPGFTRRDASSVWLTWSDLSSGVDHLRIASVTTTAGVSTIASPLFAVVPASVPFGGGENSVRLWIHSRTNVTGLAPFSDRYTLVTAQYSGADWYLCPELTSDGQASLSHGAPTNGLKSTGPVATISNRHFAPILADIRTYTSAQLLEYEDLTTQAGALRQAVTAAGAGAICGGHLQELTFGRVNPDISNTDPRGFENGFIRDPAQSSLTDLGAGGMSAGTYQVQVVYAYIDTAGRIHRSAPSENQSVTIAANRQIRVTALALLPTERHFSALTQSTRLEIYMTAANRSTFYRRANVTAAFSTSPFITVDFSTDPDTSSEIIYTSGNRFPNRPAPSARRALVSHDAMWMAGLWERRMLEVSKITAVNQPTRFTRGDQFRAIAPFDVLALAELDDQIVVIGRDGIAIMSAQAPNDQGNPPLQSPILLSSTGAVSDQILTVPAGVLFQGKRGMYLVPRGGGEPEFIGSPIQADVSSVFNMCEAFESGLTGEPRPVPPSRLVAVGMARPDGQRFTAFLDVDTMRWVSEDTVFGDVMGMLSSPEGDALAFFPIDSTQAYPAQMSPAAGSIDSAASIIHTPLIVETNWLRPFDLLGWGYVRVAQLALTVLEDTNSTLRLEVAKDGGPFVAHPADIAMPAVGMSTVEWQIAGDQPCNSIRFRVRNLSTSGARLGAIFHGLMLDVDKVEGLARIVPSQRI